MVDPSMCGRHQRRRQALTIMRHRAPLKAKVVIHRMKVSTPHSAFCGGGRAGSGCTGRAQTSAHVLAGTACWPAGWLHCLIQLAEWNKLAPWRSGLAAAWASAGHEPVFCWRSGQRPRPPPRLPCPVSKAVAPAAPRPTHRHLPALRGGGQDLSALQDAAQTKALPGEAVMQHARGSYKVHVCKAGAARSLACRSSTTPAPTPPSTQPPHHPVARVAQPGDAGPGVLALELQPAADGGVVGGGDEGVKGGGGRGVFAQIGEEDSGKHSRAGRVGAQQACALDIWQGGRAAADQCCRSFDA